MKIYHNEREYNVSERVEYLISKFEIKEYAVKILETENYKIGKIPEYILLSALTDENEEIRKNWIDILSSEIYKKGLISNDIILDLVEIKLSTNWSIIDEKYKKGIIKENHLIQLFKILKENKWDNPHFEIQIDSILIVLSSKEYEEEKISNETIDLLLSNRKEIEFLEHCILKKLLNKECISTSCLNDEILKLLFESKNNIINIIIYYITELDIIKKEEKEKYIQTVLKLENKENLEKIFKLYYANDHVDSMHDFAKQFVLYTLLLSQEELNNGYTRKKKNK